jgi:excisionase family DNA binding protein
MFIGHKLFVARISNKEQTKFIDGSRKWGYLGFVDKKKQSQEDSNDTAEAVSRSASGGVFGRRRYDLDASQLGFAPQDRNRSNWSDRLYPARRAGPVNRAWHYACAGSAGRGNGGAAMKCLLLSVPEAAVMLGLTPKGLWTMVGRRDIDTVKVGRLRKIPLSAIEDYIAEHTTPARPKVQ